MKVHSIVAAALLILLTNGSFAQELPVSRVVLYTSGVGFFEHLGTVTGNASVPLSFPEEQVGDVLKSLILRDPQGSVGIVSYPSQEPLERSLARFGLDLSGPGGLAALLPQFRGAELTLETPEPVTGRLVGLDQRSEKTKTKTWLTLSTAEGLKVVALASVRGLRLLDPRLNQELAEGLLLLATAQENRKRTITAQFSGTGTRNIGIGYVAQAPVWKTTYRIDLSGSKPYLQAWAAVENTSEADWNQIRLSLVSGRQLPLPRAMMAKSLSADSGFEAMTDGTQAGEFFQFTLQTPLTLARHQSALIPLAAAEVTAQKVSVFNAAVDPVHPQNAVWITNTTGLRLPAGPVTVFDGGVYGGDSLTDTLMEKEKQLWAYAIDLAVKADLDASAGQTTTKISVVRGVLQTKKVAVWTQTYQFSNAAAEARTLVVEHPYRNDRTLIETPAPSERTPSFYRFSLSAPAGGRAVLTVKEEKVLLETQGLSGWKTEQLWALVQSSGPLGAKVKAALQRTAELKTKWERTVQEGESVLVETTEIEKGQERIRANLDAVGRDSTQGLVYLKRLLDSEVQLDGLKQKRDANRQAQAAAQRELEDYLGALTVE